MARKAEKNYDLQHERPYKTEDENGGGNEPPFEKLAIEEVSVALALSNATLRALSSFGSKKVVDSILDILELEYSISINDVSRRPEAFARAIDSMFGPGSHHVMKVLCAEIAREIGVPRGNRSLIELVSLARAKYAMRKAEAPSTATIASEVFAEK